MPVDELPEERQLPEDLLLTRGQPRLRHRLIGKVLEKPVHKAIDGRIGSMHPGWSEARKSLRAGGGGLGQLVFPSIDLLRQPVTDRVAGQDGPDPLAEAAR